MPNREKLKTKFESELRQFYCDLVLRLINGEISTGEYESSRKDFHNSHKHLPRVPSKFRDDALSEFVCQLDLLLDDGLTGDGRMDQENRQMIETYILFLRTQKPWPWQSVRRGILFRLADFFLMGYFTNKVRPLFESLPNYWPFSSESEWQAAKDWEHLKRGE
jgi:hypothetical protein